MSNRLFYALMAVVGLLIGTGLFTLYGVQKTGYTPAELFTAERPDSYHSGIQRASPAVVSVYSSETIYRRTEQRLTPVDPFGIDNSIAPNVRRQTNQGSGVIINDEGFVLTNYHLVRDADEINIALADGRLFTARNIGADPETDLAVVKIDAAAELPWCSLEHDSTAEVGDIVLAIGNPFGVGQTVTQGIVSATQRQFYSTSRLQHFVQIDAAINPGNSGGALVNPRGDLLGINTAIFSNQAGAQGISFAIPTRLIRQVVPEIIEHGRVIRGWLGIGAENLHLYPDLYRVSQHGAVISTLFENGPAHLAGLRPGDIVTIVNDTSILNSQQLLTEIAALEPGAVIHVTGIRQNREFKVTINIAERPPLDS
ncbi:MAG: trypsin-like peptidase domain-containing protein [Granulosicoccus sp.]|nr:trypsin-like peptidase domain-containing protein [Granulosicoccus sp.]